MKIVIESHIPFIRDVFEPYATVEYLDPDDITAESVRSADALIVRTRTRCDAGLLDGSKCRVIATATIGTDHIDLDYCRDKGIKVFNAPGCNAPAVAQYVLSAIAPASGKTIGIVGAGHVGHIVEEWAKALGMNVLLNDPPRQSAEQSDSFTDLATIANEADIITFHTPLIKGGQWPTYHLADAQFFNSLRRKPIIINAARGPIVDTQALLHAINTGLVSKAIIDCWEGEPHISPELLSVADVATPH
ncbi:MAG: 4-phosphoerythronate dehydrogenase, partial [Muribaculaceae bacterium]|nr:4-phosphoerythronate dehydrogenase [Muribaculaceae bacterium]